MIQVLKDAFLGIRCFLFHGRYHYETGYGEESCTYCEHLILNDFGCKFECRACKDKGDK